MSPARTSPGLAASTPETQSADPTSGLARVPLALKRRSPTLEEGRLPSLELRRVDPQLLAYRGYPHLLHQMPPKRLDLLPYRTMLLDHTSPLLDHRHILCRHKAHSQHGQDSIVLNRQISIMFAWC